MPTVHHVMQSWASSKHYPATEIIKGKVWTGQNEEIHFWKGLRVSED
jgi:hypothetical protein